MRSPSGATECAELPGSTWEWAVGPRRIDLRDRALVMGVLNTTPDSFSDGGRFSAGDRALAHALEMLSDGADIIDVGGESTRPGAAPVDPATERDRTIPVISALRSQAPDCLISIDTSKAEVARAALEAGADIVNDVTALRGDPGMAAIIAESGCGLVLMHMQGDPRTMQAAPRYDDVVGEVDRFLRQRTDDCVGSGIARERIVVDPGIGFGKTLAHNLALLRALHALCAAGRPVLVGVSRKSLFGRILGTDELEARTWPTVAVTALAREAGARLVRVHDVAPNRQALRMTEAILAVGHPAT